MKKQKIFMISMHAYDHLDQQCILMMRIASNENVLFYFGFILETK